MKKWMAILAAVVCAAVSMTGCMTKVDTSSQVSSEVSSASEEVSSDAGSEESGETGSAAEEQVPEEDAVLANLLAANNISVIMRDHSALTCVSESWDGENNWQNKVVRQFVMSDGRLWYDMEQYDDGDNVVYCEAGYVNDDVPGALYTWEKDGMKTMTLSMASEYEAFVADCWLHRSENDVEKLVSTEADEEYHNTTYTTRLENSMTGVAADVVYFTDSETGLITGLEITEYSSEDGSVASVTRANILYDEPRIMEEQAAMNVTVAENPCELTVVINPGQANEEIQNFKVDRYTMVEFASLSEYAMYADEACTETLDWIDVNQDAVTVYIVTK